MTGQGDRLLIWIAAGAAVLMGLAVQHQLGAPAAGLMVQAGGAVLGAILMLGLSGAHPPRRASIAAIGLAAILLVMAAPLAFGPELAGARRWLMLGPVSVQPSMVVLPLAIWLAVGAGLGWIRSVLMMAAGCVLALQFDAAALTGLTLAWLAAHAASARREGPLVWAVALGLMLLTAWVWIRPDALPSVAYVEQVLPNAWAHGVWTGVAAALAMLLVLTPLILRARDSRAALSLTAFYLGLVAAALVGNYPMPVVGLGASLVMGWLMALGLATASSRSRPFP